MTNYYVKIVNVITKKKTITIGLVACINHNGAVKYGGVAANNTKMPWVVNIKSTSQETNLKDMKI